MPCTTVYLPESRAFLGECSKLDGHSLLAIVFPAFLHKEGVGGHPAPNAGALSCGCWDDHVGALLLDERFYGVQGGAWRERDTQREVGLKEGLSIGSA